MNISTIMTTTLVWLGLTANAMAQPVLEQIGPALDHPWGMDFISDDELLVTERSGGMLRINLETGAHQRIGNLPPVAAYQQGGMLDVQVDQTRADPRTIYFCYAQPLASGTVTTIARATLDADRLSGMTVIFAANNPRPQGYHYGCRLRFSGGYLFASLGDRGQRHNAQNPSIHDGSILRLNLDGTAPADNPRRPDWAPEIYSIGHRNPQGMAVHPETGAIWTHEHGPRGGDEINIITAGGNYGWPVVSHGTEYRNGEPVSAYKTKPGYEDPSWVWFPSIAPSGMAFYPARNGKVMFPELAGGVLVGSLKFQRLYHVALAAEGGPASEQIASEQIASEQIVVDQTLGRVRDVKVAADGAILILNDANPDSDPVGGLFRLSQ
ncbi:MAG: PQQ-dependent sugar dehydrogenase [Alphaproteobacteria bacterium]|nr:PQQ-dependent sugar dehydrogenase [Alphaproteobacteria bacterium]